MASDSHIVRSGVGISSNDEDYGSSKNDLKRRSGTLEETIDECQSGEFVGHMGFVPIRFLDNYLFREQNEKAGEQAKKIAEIVDKIVDRVIVTSPNDVKGSTVQMRLVQNVFQGSEVWITRDKGEYQVEFKTSSNDVNQFLCDRKSDLKDRLEKNLNLNVKVVVARNDRYDNVNNQI